MPRPAMRNACIFTIEATKSGGRQHIPANALGKSVSRPPSVQSIFLTSIERAL